MTGAVLTLAQRQRRTRMILLTGATLVSLWVALPIYFLLANALSTPEAVNSFPKNAVPHLDVGSIQYLLDYEGVLKSLFNSLAVAMLTMVGSITLGAPAGYALARYEFKGKGGFDKGGPGGFPKEGFGKGAPAPKAEGGIAEKGEKQPGSSK